MIRYSVFFYKIKNFFKKNKNAVFVGISGGVDSTVSAFLLKRKGENIVGVFMKVYQPEIVTHCWRNELIDAWRVSKELNIPFLFFNLESEYKEKIFNYMIEEYKLGRTPNPDVFCNKFIKFGVFLDKSLELGATNIAMGHYAKKIEKKGKFYLSKPKDRKKDQTYFLSSINQEQLKRAIFPLEDLTKFEVREIAKKEGFFNANKKDSQGLCFVGKVDMRDFLKNYLEIKKGKVLSTEGEVIGEHDGVWFYTIGGRHGFKIYPKAKKPNMPKLYILKKDLEKNILIVGEKNKEGQKILNGKRLLISNLNWISGKPDLKKDFQAMIRYRGENKKAKIFEKGNFYEVEFYEEQEAIALGQILVIYDREFCLGSGIIDVVLQ